MLAPGSIAGRSVAMPQRLSGPASVLPWFGLLALSSVGMTLLNKAAAGSTDAHIALLLLQQAFATALLAAMSAACVRVPAAEPCFL